MTTKKPTKSNTTGLKRAAIYVRVSSEQQAVKKDKKTEQVEAKFSPQAQERDCWAYCEARGYVVVEVYRDIDKYRVGQRMVEPSGTRADRPQLRRMIADADKGRFDVIIAWREDRLYRAFRPMLDVLDCIERSGIVVELTNDSFDARFAPIKAWAANLELEAKHERHVMGMMGRLEKGKSGNNPPLYGYKVVDGHYAIDPAEARWVTQTWQWYAEGIKAREIRRRLIAADAPQRHATKHRWHKGVIQQMLAKECYHTGFTTFEIGGQRYEIPLPILIDAETARRVKARRDNHKIYPAGNLKSMALAAGKVYCAACKVRMQVVSVKSRGKTYYYYRCGNNLHGLHRPDCVGNVNMGNLDSEIWGKVWKALTEEGEFETAIEARIAELKAQEVDAKAECERLERQLDDLLMERQKVITQWRKGKMTDTDYDLQIGTLTAEQVEIENNLNKMRLLDGNQVAQLMEIAARYREDTRRGMAGLNDVPRSPKHAQKQFETRRKYIDGLVIRVDVQTDKTPMVKMVVDFSECLRVSDATGRSRWFRSILARAVRRWPLPGPRGSSGNRFRGGRGRTKRLLG